MTEKAIKVRCPQCGGEALWSTGNRYRPFCSERCRLIDLGAWASEAYRVPAEAPIEPPADFPPEAA
jgi:endogenous inhibitor of DNA gyrase (YacG/DUF329 family)